MLFLNGFVFWQSWSGIRIGLPDFTIFYTAGQVIHQGRGADLYDEHLQEQLQRSFSPIAFIKRGSVLPYNHPPFEALVFVPLARFPYVTAYFIWLFINVALVASLPLVLRSSFPILGREPLALWFLACFAFFPVFLAIMQGQDSIWVLFCYCMAYSAFRSDRKFLMGSWLALGLCKFQLILPFVFAMSFSAGRKFANGFLTVSAALFFIGAGVVGVNGWLKYPSYLWRYDRNEIYGWKLASGNSANLRGLVETIVPSDYSGVKAAVLLVLCAIVLGGAEYAWRHSARRQKNSDRLAFDISVLAAILLSYHLYPHDLSLILLAIAIALELATGESTMRPWVRKIIFGCVFLLSCCPVYLLLIYRYRQTENIGALILVFSIVLWTESMRPDVPTELTAPLNI